MHEATTPGPSAKVAGERRALEPSAAFAKSPLDGVGSRRTAAPELFAKLRGRSVVLLGHRKGKNTKERIRCNFGSAQPEGYRKALRVMRLAEKFKLPVIALIDTPGAYPGVTAEERGQAQAIARNIMEMARLKTPVVCVVIGEGGSGGALGIGVGDRVLCYGKLEELRQYVPRPKPRRKKKIPTA